jgi:hypothetical protein
MNTASKSSRDHALECFKELQQNGDLNLSDGWFTEHPQIVDRIVTRIELAILRRVAEVIDCMERK